MYDAIVTSRIDEASDMGIFPQQVVHLVMTKDEHDLLCKFVIMKPSVFHDLELEDAYEFIIAYVRDSIK